jgi:hypothetical protein
MIGPIIAAYIFTLFTVFVVIFQFALALGAPWGEIAMGGKFPGRFPSQMRIVALGLMSLHLFIALIVLIRSGLIISGYFELSKLIIWFIVVLYVIATILNIITPSKKERILWAPISVILLICSYIVANSQ